MAMAENAVRVVNLEKNYRKIKAVDGISFEIPEGEAFGLLVPTARKTTTVRILLTLIQPSAGSAYLRYGYRQPVR